MSEAVRSISALARAFGLSRSALLHYDRVGLLRPARRSAKGYRVYSEADARRLEDICTLRRAGLGLTEIQRILGSGDARAPVLERRLRSLDGEIRNLQAQQRMIVGLLRRPELLEGTPALDKAAWVALLRASGFSEADMDRWHEAFEGSDPERHQRFLEFLGLDAAAIAALRRRSARR
ncbi:MAG TPA: MerR family transcriptional regulator [Holophagaceae bacterium]|nr:MerR family transcriptional regulator [Holophagaceae bacterium]